MNDHDGQVCAMAMQSTSIDLINVPATDIEAWDRKHKGTVIDLSHDNEADDPTYSPTTKRVSSPIKSPARRKKIAGLPPPPWKSQTTLKSFFTSPSKTGPNGVAKYQSTMDAFIKQERPSSSSKSSGLNLGPPETPEAPLPSPFRYESPTYATTDKSDLQLQQAFEASMNSSVSFEFTSQMATQPETPASSPNNLQSSAITTLTFHSTGTSLGSPKISHTSSAYTADLFTSIPIKGEAPIQEHITTKFDPLASAELVEIQTALHSRTSDSIDSERAIPQPARCESPSKRKFSDLVSDGNLTDLSVRSEARSPSPDPLGTMICSSSSASSMGLSHEPLPNLYKRHLSSTENINTISGSHATIGHSTPKTTVGEDNVAPRKSPSTIKPIKVTKTTENTFPSLSESEEVDPSFVVYDPYEDTVEMHNMKTQTRPPKMETSGLIPTETVSLENHNIKTAMGISLASRIDRRKSSYQLVRPYLSRQGRDFLAHMGRWDGYKQFEGQLIHCGFTARETSILRTRISKFTGLQGLEDQNDVQYIAYARAQLINSGANSLHSCMHYASKYLPGRSSRDCTSYVEDCALGDVGPRDYLIISSASKPSRSRQNRQMLRFQCELGNGRDRCSVGSESFRQIQHGFVNSLRPWKVFKEGSSDILDLAWAPSGEAFALGAATLNDVYNRPGNLVLGSIPLSKTRMLHGHQEPRPEPIGAADPVLHSTVSGVGFSPTGLLYSAGYDGTVRVWHPEAGIQLSSHKMLDRVVSLSVSPYHENVVASGSSQGLLELTSWTDNGDLNTKVECDFGKVPTEALYPACLAWASPFYNQYLIAGYDNQSGKSSTGSLVIYDANQGTLFHRVSPGSTKHYDLFTHSSGTFVTACAARNTSRTGVKSNIRQFNMTSTGATCILDVDSPQIDINRVTISPCGTFVTSSGTDGSTLCWDTRFPERILQKLQHGPTLMNVRENTVLELDDTGVEVALWGHNSDYFYTGSSDGVVKIWDLKRGDPFVKDLGKVNAQIMSGQFSPEKDMLLIGDASGTATLFSIFGEDDGTPPTIFETEGEVLPDQVERTEADVPETHLARYYSAELIREGRVVIGPDGYGAWAA